MNRTMSERPRCCRNLTSAFDAVSVADAAVEPRELSENRENLFVEHLINSDCERFKQRWGYDPKEDAPVEGSDWEYELIRPEASRRLEGAPPGEAPIVEAVVEAPGVEAPLEDVSLEVAAGRASEMEDNGRKMDVEVRNEVLP